jgi:hypothetical protein
MEKEKRNKFHSQNIKAQKAKSHAKCGKMEQKRVPEG